MFRRKEFRGKLAIAITANFVNGRTTAEAVVEEIRPDYKPKFHQIQNKSRLLTKHPPNPNQIQITNQTSTKSKPNPDYKPNIHQIQTKSSFQTKHLSMQNEKFLYTFCFCSKKS